MVKITAETQWNPQIIARLKAMARVNGVEVGYPQDLTYESGQKVVDVAWRNEFGTPRTPPRPFIRPTIARRSGHWFRKVRDGYVFYKTEEKLKAMFENLGKAICVNLQQAIDKVNTPPLSPVTIERRKAKGNHSTKPLIDTGKMRNELSYRVAGEGDWKK